MQNIGTITIKVKIKDKELSKEINLAKEDMENEELGKKYFRAIGKITKFIVEEILN